MLRLILEKQLLVKEVLMVTFTKAAVAELEERRTREHSIGKLFFNHCIKLFPWQLNELRRGNMKIGIERKNLRMARFV